MKNRLRKSQPLRSDSDDDPVTCSHCRRPTPAENLHCVYCGELLNKPVGFISGLALGGRGRLGLVLVALLLLFFLIWLLC